jgi:hypothetical protein
MGKLTKKQAKEFARIQSGVLIYNVSGTEFEDAELSDTEEDMLYEYMANHWKRLLKNQEQKLASTDDILEYVRTNF